MRRLLLVFILCATGAVSVSAQTTVNLQVTDTPDNQTWNNGTWTVKLIPPAGNLSQTNSFTLLSGGGSLANQNGSLSASGAASMSLPANANIGPGGTVWQFSVCSQQATACANANITVTTSSPQSVTISPPSIRVASQPNLPPVLVYTTAEISSAAVGSQITVVGSTPATPVLQTCIVVSGSTCTTWSAVGGGTSVVGFPLGNTVYESTACPASTSNCFQVFNDVHATNNAVYTNTSTSVSTASTDPAFVAGDVGKIEFGAGRCPGTVSNCHYDVPQGTIQSVNSAHNVTVSVAATNTNSGTANANNFFWGHDDGPTHVLAFAALFPATFSGNIIPEPAKALQLACGISFTSVNPFLTSTTTSSNGGGLNGCGGGGSTVIMPLPRMNCNTATVFTSTFGCLFVSNVQNLQLNGLNLGGWHVRDLTFWGGGTDVKDAAATFGVGTVVGIITEQFDELDNVLVIGWLWNQAASVIGLQSHGSLWVNSGSVAGGSQNCQLLQSNSVNAVMLGGTCGGGIPAAFDVINIPAGAQAYTAGVYVNQTGFGVHNAGGLWFSHGDYITGSMKSDNASANSYLAGTALDQFGGGNSALTISAGTVHLASVFLKGAGANVNQTGGTISDDCGNVLQGTAPVFTAGGVFGHCSLIQSATNLTVASRNTALTATNILGTVRWPAEAVTIVIYAYDSAAGVGCTGNSTVTWTVGYTDQTGTAQTSTATETITTNGGATGGDAMKVSLPISTQNNTAVTVAASAPTGGSCATTVPSFAAKIEVI